MAQPEAATAKLVGGDPSIDFVNTVGGRVPAGRAPGGAGQVLRDKLGRYEDLLAWGRHAALLDEAAARGLARLAQGQPRRASRVLGRALAGREALHSVLTALMDERPPLPSDLALVNAEIAAARRHERLVPTRGGLRWDTAAAVTRLDSVLWPVWRAAARLVTSGDAARLRRCEGDDCGWLFLDRSRNHSRRWCTMEDCGNVSKVRRFRERQHRPS